MSKQHSANRASPSDDPSRRDFLRTAAGSVAAFAFVTFATNARVIASGLRGVTLSPEARADAWFDSKMAEREYVESTCGALRVDGKIGYWSGGPGASAQTIYQTLRGSGGRLEREIKLSRQPYDADDFGRCLELLDAVPEWRGRIAEMSSVSPNWSSLAKQWSALEKLYRERRFDEVSQRIDRLTA